MSPNVEEEQTHANGPASSSVSENQLLPKDEPQSRRKEEIKDEEATPKLELEAVDVKEEPSERDAGARESDTLREELPRDGSEIPPYDSEDSLGPEQVANELRRLTEAHSQMMGTDSIREPREGAPAPDAVWEIKAHMHLRDQEDIVVDQRLQIHVCLPRLSGKSMTRKEVRVHMRNLLNNGVLECRPWKLTWRH